MTGSSFALSPPKPQAPHGYPAVEPALASAEKTLTSEHLLNGRREILIRHGDRIYRLRHTSNDKLILTK